MMTSGFNAAALLEEYGDRGLVRDLAELVVTTTSLQLDKIQAAVAAGDAQSLRTAAHCLRGSIAAFGVPSAVEAAKKLEAMGAAGELSGAEPLTEQLAQDISALRDGAKAWLASGAV